MKQEELSDRIDEMVSDFLFLDEGVIDIPSAGKFLNHIDGITAGVTTDTTEPVRRVACALRILIERLILDSIDQREGYLAVEGGITVMRGMIGGAAGGTGDAAVEEFMDRAARLVGSAADSDGRSEEAVMSSEGGSAAIDGGKRPFERDDEAVLRDFVTEGLEYLSDIETQVLNLEQCPEDSGCINALFRPFHSIKGVAGFLNLDDISNLAHDMEDLLDRVRTDHLSVTAPLIDIILSGTDALKEMIGSLQDVLDGIRSHPSRPDMALLRHRIAQIEDRFEEEGTVEKLGTILVGDGVITEETLAGALETAQEYPPKRLGETLLNGGAATSRQVSQALRKQAGQVMDAGTIRVDVKKLDDMVDMVGELVITQAMIKENPVIKGSEDKKLLEGLARLAGITSELQRTSTGLRMVPIRKTFQRMARLIRDLARESGKVVAVEMAGEDTEIDRNMTEEIYTPLVHMVRNAVDHGIEEPRTRISMGKPERGLISLSACHRGGNIVIEIADDGRGLDRKRILERAVEKGFMAEREELSERDIDRLLFLPGLSTAERVTDISGRGVGMDIVKEAVEQLQGKIDVSSSDGKGSTFTALFPLTMAIIDGMIVRVGSEQYIIPTASVRQLMRPRREHYHTVAGRGEVLEVMGESLPLLRLHKIFGTDGDHRDPWDSLVVVVEAEERSKCVCVDEVMGKEEVVIKSLGEKLKNVQGVSGGAILGSGSVGLILDPDSLFALCER